MNGHRHRLRLPIGQAAGFTLLFTLIVVPTTYQLEKAALLLGTLGLIAAREVGRGRLALAPPVLVRILAFSGAGALFVLVGLLRGAPGALALAPVHVVWPVVYGLLMVGVAEIRRMQRMLRLLVAAALFIELYALSYIAFSAGFLPGGLYVPLDQGQEIGFYGGYVEFALYSVTSLIFLIPFLISLLICTPANEPVPGGRVAVSVAVILGIIVVLLSGRRALMLVVAASPLIALLLRRDLPYARRLVTTRSLTLNLAAAGGAAFLIASVTLGLRAERLQLALSSAFDFSTAEGAARGPTQLQVLLAEWLEAPVFGQGLGAVAAGLIRSAEQPWAYELSYVALLFHVGIVGVAVYAYGLFWTVQQSRRIARQGGALAAPAVAILVGLLSFLAANFTNPYLLKFDSLWVLFLPVALINTWMLRNADAPATEPERVQAV